MTEVDFSPKTPEETSPTPVDFGPSPAMPSMSVAAGRAQMMHDGLNPVLNKTVDDIHAAIASGREHDVRAEASMSLDDIKLKLKQDAARTLGQMPNPGADAINRLAQPLQRTDPKSVAEEAWGHQFIQQVSQAAYGNMKDTTYAQAVKDIPRVVEDVKRQGGIIAARNQYIQKWASDADDAVKKQTGLFGSYERALSFIPFYDEVKIRSALANVLPGLEKLGLGDYLAEASRRLLSMPFPQFTQMMDEIFEPLVKSNPHEAAYVLEQLTGQSTGDRFLQNFSTAMDVSSLPGVAGVVKGVGKLAGLARATKDVADVTADSIRSLKWSGSEPPTLKDIPEGWWATYKPGTKEWYLETARRASEAAGDMKEAGIKKAAEDIVANVKDDTALPKQAVDALTANFRLDKDHWIANIGAGGRELAERIKNKFEAFDGKFADFLNNLRRTETLSDVMSADVTARAIEKTIKENYRGVNNSIQDVVYKGLNPQSNTYRYELHIFNPDGQPFKQFIQAGANKNLNGLLDAEIVKEGMGYKLVRTINLDENQRAVQDLLSKNDVGKIQKTWFEGSPLMQAVNRFRTPKEILSFDENMQRELATHSPGVLLGMAKEELEPVAKLPKGLPFTSKREKWGQFWRALEHAKYAKDPLTGDPGRWFENGAEMDDFFLRNFNRVADPAEKEAYMAVVRNVELNRVYDSIRLYSNKAKWGGEQHRIYAYDADGKRFNSNFFEGRIERDIGNFGLSPETPVYVQIGKGPGVVYSWGAGKNPISKRIADGTLKAVQIWNPDYRPLSNFSKIGERRIQWVISDKFETKPLDWETQIPRRGGGHFVYDYNYYIKQAKIRADQKYHWHEGDTTLMPISIRKMGQDIVKHLNEVRVHIKEGREEAAETYHNANSLPMSWEEHRGWYRDSHEGGTYKPARADVNEPWHLVPKDKTVADMDNSLQGRYGKTFRDSGREGNPARQMMVQFTGERDAQEVMTIGNDGTRVNPIYTYEPAAFADPVHVMNRALNRAVNSIWMQDMKTYSMNHWLKQAAEYMDVNGSDKLGTVLHSPTWHFNNPKWLDAWKNSPEVAKLKNAQHQMKQFIGVPSKIETALHSIQQNMADMLYSKGFRTIPDWLMHEARDPLGYLRSAVVHMKLGLFNPTSFFVQASTHLNIWGIAGPKHAAPGAMATYLHSLARVNQNPEILAALGKRAEYMGWRPGEWQEAWKELNMRGFTNIGHTHAFTDAPYQGKILQTKWGRFLDAGHVFFREGAQSVRTAAWYTAYHEWRNGASWTPAHSTGRLTKQDWDRVLTRAADLDHNMSRAANSQIQSGFLSFPTQFQSYHLRLLELMTGKRLTPMEKAGLFTATTLAYGIPIGGLGLFAPFAGPVSDSIKRNAQEVLGYTPNDHFISDAVMRGIPDAMLGQIFGTQFNIAERWGPGKFDVLENLLNGSEPWWALVGGAAGSTLANIYQNSSPLIRSGIAFITGHSDDFKMTGEDWLRPLEEVSSIASIAGFLRTVETGRLLSKNGTYLSDVSKSKWTNAFMRYVVGLTPQRVSDIHDNFEWDKQEKASYNEAEKNIIRELHAMYEARKNNDPDQAAAYQKRAMSYAVGLPENVKVRIWATAARTANKPLADNVEEQRNLRNVPKGQEDIRREIHKKIIQQGQ